MTVSDLEKFTQTHQIFELQRMSFLDVALARRIAVRKFVFRHSRNHQLFIEDIASSSTMREMLNVKSMAKSGNLPDIDTFCWFSKQVSAELSLSVSNAVCDQ